MYHVLSLTANDSIYHIS